jgi:hypothetical protein
VRVVPGPNAVYAAFQDGDGDWRQLDPNKIEADVHDPSGRFGVAVTYQVGENPDTNQTFIYQSTTSEGTDVSFVAPDTGPTLAALGSVHWSEPPAYTAVQMQNGFWALDPGDVFDSYVVAGYLDPGLRQVDLAFAVMNEDGRYTKGKIVRDVPIEGNEVRRDVTMPDGCEPYVPVAVGLTSPDPAITRKEMSLSFWTVTANGTRASTGVFEYPDGSANGSMSGGWLSVPLRDPRDRYLTTAFASGFEGRRQSHSISEYGTAPTRVEATLPNLMRRASAQRLGPQSMRFGFSPMANARAYDFRLDKVRVVVTPGWLRNATSYTMDLTKLPNGKASPDVTNSGVTITGTAASSSLSPADVLRYALFTPGYLHRQTDPAAPAFANLTQTVAFPDLDGSGQRSKPAIDRDMPTVQRIDALMRRSRPDSTSRGNR